MNEPGPATAEERRGSCPVFISYATADRKEALSVCKAIERRGTQCWISTRNVEPGGNYQEEIVRAIRDARAMVLVFSEAANNSDEIKKELSLASRHHVPVMALRIDDVEPSDAFAYELSTRQWIDAFEGWDKAIDALVNRLAQIAAPSEDDARQPQVQPTRARHARAGHWSRHNIARTALALVALIAVAVGFYLRSAREQVSLAVLPFADLSPARDKAYFAEGVAEEIQSSLAAEKDLKVLGRTSAGEIQRNADPRAVRASLGVTHLLEGSARTAGNDLRVNVRLIDTSDGSQLWEEEYRGAVSDVFKVQDEIATAVVRRLRGTFFSAAVRAAPATTIDAYETYLAARALIRETTRESITRAWQMARATIDAHPDYAPGHALYADATSLLAEGPFTYGSIPPEKARRIAVAHAREAIRLAPDRADGYAALGLALPPHEAIDAYQKALQLDPSRVDVRGRLAIALNELKRNDEAFEHYRLGVEMDPLSQASLNRYAQTLAASGRAADAMRAIDLFEHRGGSKAQAWRFRGNTYRYLANESRHIESRRRALKLDPKLPYQHEWLAQSLHLLGLNDQAAAYRPQVSAYFQMFIDDDRGALRQRLLEDGPRAWNANGIPVAVFSLARARDWAAIIRFYDVRPADHRDLCGTTPPFTVFVVMALGREGRSAESRRLLDCTQRQVTRQRNQRYRNPDDAPGELEMTQASLLALRNDRRALDWLDTAVQRGWLGQYYSSKLDDWPQFDLFRTDPRYIAVQKRIDAIIGRERAELLAGR